MPGLRISERIEAIREHWALRKLTRWEPDPAQAKTIAICLTAMMILLICLVTAILALRETGLLSPGMKTLM